jgi:hypothetical protein
MSASLLRQSKLCFQCDISRRTSDRGDPIVHSASSSSSGSVVDESFCFKRSMADPGTERLNASIAIEIF